MEYKWIQLGKNDGFYQIYKNRKSKVYPTLELLKAAEAGLGVIFLQYKGMIIPFSDIQKVFGEEYYEYYDTDSDIHYVFQPMSERQVMSIGYLVFCNGDSVRYEKAGNMQKALWRQIQKYIGYISYERAIKVTGNSKLISIVPDGTTERIDICHNSYIIDKNNERKESGLDKWHSRCFPYEKCMDKYSTFYVLHSIERSDPSTLTAGDIVTDIVDLYNDSGCSDDRATFHRVEFFGTIIF